MNVTRKLLTKCHNYDIILGTGVGTVSGPLKYFLKDKRLFDMAFGILKLGDVCDLGSQLFIL